MPGLSFQHIFKPCYDPNERFMENGLQSEDLNPRPINMLVFCLNH